MKWRWTIYQVELNVIVIKMLTELRRRMDVYSDNLNKKVENIKKNQAELKNAITEI